MKKGILILSIIITAFAVTGCGSKESKKVQTPKETTAMETTTKQVKIFSIVTNYKTDNVKEWITTEDIKSAVAQSTLDGPGILLTFTESGKKKLEEMTSDDTSKDMDVLVDGESVSHILIGTTILSDTFEVNGFESDQVASDVADKINNAIKS